MKTRAYRLFIVGICALFVLLSADGAFAQKNWKKGVKGAKNARVTSTRKLSGKGKTKLSTKPTPAPVSNIKKPVAVQSMTHAPVNAAVEAAQKAAQKPSTFGISSQAKRPLATPAPTQDSGSNLTGMQVLQTYFPTWRQELGGMFSKEQLDAVEKAFADTDDFMFVRGADGELKARNKDEWNYEARFLTFLQDSGVEFTERQIKQLIGSKGMKGFTLNRCLTLKNIHAFIKAHDGHSPRTSIKENGRVVSMAELRARVGEGDRKALTLAIELELGRNISTALQNWPTNSPEYVGLRTLLDENRNRAANKTPEQVIAMLKKFQVEHDGRNPRKMIKEGGKSLTITELRARVERGDLEAAQLVEELELGGSVDSARKTWPKDSAKFLELEELYNTNRNRAVRKTPEQIIAMLKKFQAEHNDRNPRKGITENGKWRNISELRALAKQGDAQFTELADELELGVSVVHALQTWPKDSTNFLELQALYDKSRERAIRKTPEQFIVAYKKWLAEHNNQSPRQNIVEGGEVLSLTELRKRAKQGSEPAIAALINELELGRGLGSALKSWFKDSSKYLELKALYDESRNRAASKPTNELYQDLVAHIKDYGHYPMQKEGPLARIIHFRLGYYQSTMTADGKYTDPYLQKIYEIKQWSERVKRGEVDWEQFPELFKKHRRTIGEIMREKGQLPAKEAPKVVSLPKEEQAAIEQIADNMLTLWEDFEGVWWQQNHKHIITTPQTQVAFNTVLKTVQTQVPGTGNVNISNVLEQVSSMQLGQDGPDYYRVIYRGNNPRLPRAEDFHNVLETQGITQADAANAYKLNSPHIELDGDEELVYNLFVRKDVTDKEMSAVIDALTPAGWEIRLGAHELLHEIKQGWIHIHIEQVVPTTEEDAQDISNVLRVDLRALTQGKNPQQIAKTLRYLFAKYLKEDGHQALNNIQKAF